MGTVHPIRRACPPAETGCLCEQPCNPACPYRQREELEQGKSWLYILASFLGSVAVVAIVLGPQIAA